MRRVAIQGIRGSYSEDAVLEMLGADAEIVECEDFDATYAAVEKGEVDNAVVPVANKIVGEIARSVELLNASGLRVIDGVTLKIRHVLAGTLDAEFDRLTSVRSHVEALRQCRAFLANNSQLTQVAGGDTASSIRSIVADGDPKAGAIGSRRAADLHGAKVIREDIADDNDNWTTFYLIGR